MRDYNVMTPDEVQRHLKGLNLNHVARSTGLTIVTIHRYAKGLVDPRWSTLVKLTKYLRGDAE